MGSIPLFHFLARKSEEFAQRIFRHRADIAFSDLHFATVVKMVRECRNILPAAVRGVILKPQEIRSNGHVYIPNDRGVAHHARNLLLPGFRLDSALPSRSPN